MSTSVADARTAEAATADARTVDARTGDARTGDARTVDPDDPREDIEIAVLLPNGRFAPRQFATIAEAEAWARPEEGERVVELNILCECTF